MAAVSKVCYEAWEKDVIAAFYTSDNLQSDFRPRDGCLSVVSEEKVVLVVLEGDRRIADMVSFAVETNLPAKSKLQLFHIDKEQVDGVSYGLAENGEFVHPAIDFGGLTNYQQILGETPVNIQGKQVVVQPHCDCSTVARELQKIWAEVANTQLPSILQNDLESVVKSVQKVFSKGAALRFWQVPPEHRVIVTLNNVLAETRRYYVRCFAHGKWTEALKCKSPH